MKSGIYIFIFTAFIFSGLNQAFAQNQRVTIEQIQLLLQEKNSRTPAQKKMDSRLLQAAREKRGLKMAPGVNLEPANVNPENDGRVKVDINGEINDAFINRVRALGGEIIYASAQYHTARVLISLSVAEKVASLDEVKFIQPAVLSYTVGSGVPTSAKKGDIKTRAVTAKNIFKPVFIKRPTLAQRSQRVKEIITKYLKEHNDYNPLVLNAGVANSQGDPSHRTDETRNRYGYAGQGIKIGVLSDSYNRLGGAQADVLNDDLPGTGNPYGNTTPVTVVQDFTASGNDEGRAMLQIVHDLAPKAQLFFATGNVSEASFASNIAALRTTYGCDIVIDDLAYFDEPAFQDGIVAQAVSTVIAAGGMYFSSAGNSGSVALGTAGVWEGDFNDTGSPAFIGGTKTGTIHNFGSTPANGDSILAVGSGAYNLQWSDPWGASTNDYDLFLVNTAGTIKASSTTVQNGTQNPYESFAPPTLVAGDRFIVFKAAGAAVRAISLNSNRGRLKVATTGQTHGHSCVAEAYCVAATPATGIPFVSTNTVETFSSDGLRRIFYNADGTPITPGNVVFSTNGGTVRNKPDITAADGVATTLPASTSLNPFFGTSAAAPHAGAIAALLKSANPSITQAQMRTLLTSTALDIQTAGYDNVSGYGIIQAFQAMQSLNPTPLPYINLGTSTFTESYGNGNGSVDPGEIGNLVLQLNNSSLANAANVTVTVTTTTSGVTITQGTANYGTINSSSSASNTGSPIKFAVNSSVACGTAITFQIKITFTGGVGTIGYPVIYLLGQKTIGSISSTLGATPPTGSGYTVTTGQQTGRLVRGTAASTCAAPIANPGLTVTTGARQYDAYIFTNTTSASQCYTVTLTSPNGTNIYTAAYNSSGFVPSDPSINYVAEPGQSATTQTYSFTVSAGAAFTVVVHDVNVTPASNSPYTLSVTYTACTAGPTCTAVTISPATIANGAKGTPYNQAFTAIGGSGSYIFTLTGDLPAGLTFSGNTLSGTPTQAGSFPITVTATDPTGCPGDSKNYTLVISGIAPASVTATSGTPQSVTVCGAFTTSLQVTVKDASNNPLSGVNVKFTAPSSAASGTFTGGVTTITVVTDVNGIASAPFTANAIPGTYTVTAAVTGVGTIANFNLTNTSILVTSSADSGPGTLRDAINNACPGATITFSPSITQINLTTGELLVTNAVTITGTGANLLTVSAGNLSRVLHIAPTSGSPTLNISGITFRDGKVPASSTFGGAGILIEGGIVNITGCVVSNNDVTAMTSFSDGGAILNNSANAVTIDRSSIINNKSDRLGGAICQFGTGALNITNSTIFGNRATSATSGVGYGGGLYIGASSAVSTTNSTFFSDTAVFGGNIIRNATGAVLTFKNTIIAGGILLPTGGAAPDLYNTTSGGAISADYNLIQSTTSSTITGATAHNITGVSPNLSALTNNGGPTPTLLPLANSPVINTGDPALISSATDQRGFSRVVGGTADIGSVEANGYTFYYSKSIGSLEQLNTWGTNTDGSGTAPSSFTADNQIFTIRNNAAPVVADNWTVSGISSLLVGDGTNAVVVTIASGKTFTIGSSTSMTNQTNSSIIFSTASNFITGTGAVVNFNARSVTFKSDATGTASMGRMSGTLSNATNVTIERYFSNRRAWRLLGMPFSTSTQTIKTAWMEGAASLASDPNPGFGTQITTFTGDANAANFDAQKPASSIRIFSADNFNSDAAHTPNTTTLVTANPASFLFVRGNRTVDRTVAGAASSSTVLRATGTVATGNVSKGIAGSLFTLVANPYASAINFDSIKAIAGNAGISTFYVWDATLAGTNGVGQYRTISITGTAAPYNYSATPGGADNNYRFIESGTAFFVPGSATVAFTEATKTTGTPTTSMLRTISSTETQISVNLNIVNGDNSISLADGVREIFDNGYSAAVDNSDARKIEGFDLNLGINNHDQILAVEKRPLPNDGDTISLKLWNAAPGNYQFEIQPANFYSMPASAFLYDNYLRSYLPVDLKNNTVTNFSITSEAASAAANRFSLVFTKIHIDKPSIVIYPNPVQNGFVKVQMTDMPKGTYLIRLVNNLGQVVLTKQINHAEGSGIETIGVDKTKGVYMLEIINPDKSKTVNKLIIN